MMINLKQTAIQRVVSRYNDALSGIHGLVECINDAIRDIFIQLFIAY